MIKRLIEFLLFGTFWELIKMTSSQFISFGNSLISWLTLIGWIILIFLVAVLQWYNTKEGKGIFAFKFTGKVLSLLHINNPDLFSSLNETALKKHIDMKKKECPFSEIISRITLYQGIAGFYYELIVEAPEDHKGFSDIKRFWEREAPDLFENHFVEVYRERPNITFRHQEGSFWGDWSCFVLESNKNIPDDFVNKNHRWTLYKK